MCLLQRELPLVFSDEVHFNTRSDVESLAKSQLLKQLGEKSKVSFCTGYRPCYAIINSGISICIIKMT